MKNPTDHRKTARIWSAFIYIALRKGIDTGYRGADLDLAFVCNEANIMRITAQIACEEAGISFDELHAAIRDHANKRLTKVARKDFAKRQDRWDKRFNVDAASLTPNA